MMMVCLFVFLKREQELENCMMEKKWRKALRLAILLDKPFRCYSIVKEILEKSASEGNEANSLAVGRENLEKTLQSLRDDQISA